MIWGIWIERFAFNPGHPQPELRCWLLDSGTRERKQNVRTYECLVDAAQYAAFWRVNECKNADSTYDGEPKYGVVQARRYDPIDAFENEKCVPDVPDLSALAGWFA